MRRVSLIAIAVLLVTAVAACSSPRSAPLQAQAPSRAASTASAPAAATSTSTPSAGPASAGVKVPDVVAALGNYAFNPTYEENPEAAAAQVKAFVAGYLRGAGLEPDVKLQSIAIPDSQDPPAGAVVPPGTVVHVKVGFGD